MEVVFRGSLLCMALVVGLAPAAQAEQRFELSPPGLSLSFPDGWIRYELPASQGAVQWSLIDPTGANGSCVVAYIAAPPADTWSAEEEARMRGAQEPWQRFADDYEMILKTLYGPVQFGSARLDTLDDWPVVAIDYVIDPADSRLGSLMMLVGFGTRFAAGSLMFNCGAPETAAAFYRPYFDAIIASVTFTTSEEQARQ